MTIEVRTSIYISNAFHLVTFCRRRAPKGSSSSDRSAAAGGFGPGFWWRSLGLPQHPPDFLFHCVTLHLFLAALQAAEGCFSPALRKIKTQKKVKEKRNEEFVSYEHITQGYYSKVQLKRESFK